MRLKISVRPTIGFLSTWSVYEGTTIDDYTHALLKGVCAAANEKDCNLLIGCGIALPGQGVRAQAGQFGLCQGKTWILFRLVRGMPMV